MDYQQTLDYLYSQLPMFQRDGASAYKKDLGNTLVLCEYLGNPHQKFKSIHIAGTNGKGSTAHSISAILQKAGYKTGLYTSPHLKNFTERIRINGLEVDQDFVVDFVQRVQAVIEEIKPSFFELTVAMAFDYFAKEAVDIAVVEVGMGGRLDSTNVILPELCIITNIGKDHQQFLGETLPEIAGEKAGIIKKEVPVVISHTQQEVKQVFERVATEKQAPIIFAENTWQFVAQEMDATGQTIRFMKEGKEYAYQLDLSGRYQRYNLPGILEGVEQLRKKGYQISDQHLRVALVAVKGLTGLKGRWQILEQDPLIVCDTGHNEDGIKQILEQLSISDLGGRLHFVLGFAKDKELNGILKLFPTDANYYFCQANIPRAMAAEDLKMKAATFGLNGKSIADVNMAIESAKEQASERDIIFIGGSTFVVAEIASL